MNTPFQTTTTDLEPDTLALVGVPYDESSSFLRGAALAPPRIREVLHDGASNLCAENGLDLATTTRFRDLGDLRLDAGPTNAFEQIEHAVDAVLSHGARALLLGGDHAITYPIVKAYARHHAPLNILHLDAHPDLHDTFEGSKFSHGCPFARIMEAGLASRLVQVGIRAMSPHQRDQAKRFGVEIIEMRSWQPDLALAFEGPVYLSLDLDVLDPAFAPGVSHHEPGGLSVREVLRPLHGLRTPLVGADIVEFNPNRDPVGVTAMVAAKFIKEIAAQMLGQGAAP